jgi:chromosomal replication initiator protein
MLWKQIKDVLKDKLPATTHSLWIEPIQCENTEGPTLDLICPDRFFCSWVSENYLGVIQESLCEIGREGITVRLAAAQKSRQNLMLPVENKQQLRLPAVPEAWSFVRNLHPKYTFDEFMVGESNILAQSACKAISQGDTSFGSYLYIHAGTGLGKSHLTHAVAHEILTKSPGTRLHYLTAQQFSTEMVLKIKNNDMNAFKEKYHNHCDLLLIEDVHTLTGKLKTQEELNEILDAMMKSGKRIILTGAVAPKGIRDIDEGIRSRMAAGLISSISSPDYRTRLLITRRKAQNNNLELSESLVEYLAQNIKGDIRQLESAIVGLKAKSSLLQMKPDLEMIKELVRELAGRERELSTEKIRDFVAGQFNVRAEDLRSKSRKRTIALPRQISMYLARKYTDEGLAEIGQAFNRDHSTVLHAIRVITEAMARNSSIRWQVDLLSKKLQE